MRAAASAVHDVTGPAPWRRPVPLVGDASSAAERRRDPQAWALPASTREALYDVIGARRDIRRFRPDALDEELLLRVIAAAHAAPSVGHSQPWRFVIVQDPATRNRAAWMADRARVEQAAALEPEAGRHLMDLQLEGIREAPVGIVVCCDRRTQAAGVLGRGTFQDADLWSCACAIENLWLAARSEGLGVGWVTLFVPAELSGLLDLPEGVVPLGWLCVGWPDERPPAPGLERAGWSRRLPLDQVVLRERWPGDEGVEPAAPVSKLRAPGPTQVVGARDEADLLLTPPGSLGTLDRAAERVLSLGHVGLTGGTMVLAAGRHLVVELGVSAYELSVTDEVLAAARAGEAVGAAAAAAAGLSLVVVDAGTSTGNLRDTDALSHERTVELVERGRELGLEVAGTGLVALGEVGIGNTTVAAALAALLLDLEAADVVGRGAGADAAMLDRKRSVIGAAVQRAHAASGGAACGPLTSLACLGGPELALLAGVTLGAATGGAAIVLDGLATSVAALVAARLEPATTAHLVAGQRSREPGHSAVLTALGLEPLLDLRIRAGEGAGAALACGLLLDALKIRRTTGRTG